MILCPVSLSRWAPEAFEEGSARVALHPTLSAKYALARLSRLRLRLSGEALGDRASSGVDVAAHLPHAALVVSRAGWAGEAWRLGHD